MTNKIAYMLLTCVREESRYRVLKAVIDNIIQHPEFEKLNEDLIVFDNDSYYSDTKYVLHNTFKNVVDSQENYGYWSPIGWTVRNHAKVLGKEYEYLYLIESDQIHYAWEKLERVENFLELRSDIDSVRVREFSVKESHLYDKEKNLSESKKWAWCTQKNPFTGERVKFEKTSEDSEMYITNFTTLPPSVNRMSLMNEGISHLESLDKFTEKDFWEACYKKNPSVALLDGGICHAKLGYDREVISSHYTNSDKLQKSGYVKCGESAKIDLKGMKVVY